MLLSSIFMDNKNDSDLLVKIQALEHRVHKVSEENRLLLLLLKKDFSLATDLDTRYFLTLAELERRYITSVLEFTGWRVSGYQGAARILGLNAKTLDSKMRKLKIIRPKKKS